MMSTCTLVLLVCVWNTSLPVPRPRYSTPTKLKLYTAERDVHGLALYGGYKTEPVDFNYCTLKIDRRKRAMGSEELRMLNKTS